jgi:hypothetical protein
MLRILEALKNVKRTLMYGGTNYTCNICGRSLKKFAPFPKSIEAQANSAGFLYDFREVETLNYDNYTCPFCLSSDRERLYLFFLDNYLASNEGVYKVLDFAPGNSFKKAMHTRKRIEYLTADLLRSEYDVSIDICNMASVQDDQFNIVICSHILEHVVDPNSALREIYRVLKTDGWAIIMVPLFKGVVSTIENEFYNTELLRLKHFGQADHVRLFSKDDFIGRIENAEFMLSECGVDQFDYRLIKLYAIADNSVLYICKKSIKLNSVALVH